MINKKITQNRPIILVGGGDVTHECFKSALAYSDILIAADRGANLARSMGFNVDYIIGDMDSIEDAGTAKMIKIDEQDTTDFEKCLCTIDAPLILCVGFLGRRQDHTLAVLHALQKYTGRNIVLLGTNDVVFACPEKIDICLPVGTRISLFPFSDITGTSSNGLKWPVQGIEFSPDKMIGTSNQIAKENVQMGFDKPGMLVMLPVSALDSAITALTATNG